MRNIANWNRHCVVLSTQCQYLNAPHHKVPILQSVNHTYSANISIGIQPLIHPCTMLHIYIPIVQHLSLDMSPSIGNKGGNPNTAFFAHNYELCI